MRILFVKPLLPYPPDQGTKALTLGLLETLAPDHDVTLCTRLLRAEDAQWVSHVEALGVRVRAVLAPNRRSVAHRAVYRAAYEIRSAITGISRAGFYGACAPLREVVREETVRAPADLAVIENWFMSSMVDSARARRYALLAHDVDFSVDRLRARHGGFGRWRAYQAARRRRDEIASYARFDVIFALSDADKKEIEDSLPRRGRPPVEVLPYVAPAHDAQDGAEEGARAPDHLPAASILLFGSLHADFNIDALAWCVREILPRVRAQVPEVRLLVGGSGDPSIVAPLVRGEAVDVVGHLARPAEWMQRAPVMAVPLRVGGGVHVRVIDALRAGAAVVTTTLGTAGLPVTANRDLLVADTEDAFADALVRVLRDPAERARLSAAAHACAESSLREATTRGRAREIIARAGQA